MPAPAGFEDKEVGMLGGPDQFADLASVLGTPTRVAVLAALVRCAEPLHIQALARRVGVDASPVRTHLEVLLRAGLVQEVPGTGRERRFTTTLRDARLVLVNLHGVRAPADDRPPSKEAQKLRKKLDALARKREAVDREAAKVRADLARALAAPPAGVR